MNWTVEFQTDFAVEFAGLDEDVQDELVAHAELLKSAGPHLKRPHADTLAGSAYANMKELRFNAAQGVWRVAYAFDAERKAILLVAGDKAGVAQRRFYTALIRKADQRFTAHLRAQRQT
jgi:hypothetical protein